ncbi:MAG: sulfurtransferase-like selenium metabolism protein YedF [bacterium]
MHKKIILDLQGRPCPQPVLEIRKAMINNQEVEALVSNKDQVDNIVRMADNSDWTLTVHVENNVYRVCLAHKNKSRKSESEPGVQENADRTRQETKPASVLLISSEYMGKGDNDLGRILMQAFLETVKECSRIPQTIILLNSGIKLAAKGSLSIEALKKLEAEGVKILVCGTCLEFFHLKEDLKVGVVSNMFDIAELLMGAGVLTIS